jgi:hypothetical protein
VNVSSPSDLSGLAVWLKSDTQVYSDAGVTPAAADATVQQWNDQSGNSRNVLQATAGSRPQNKTNVLNGYPVIRFAGDFMKSSAFASAITMPFTAILVMKLADISGTTWMDNETAATNMFDTPAGTASTIRILQAGGSCTTSANVATTDWTVLTGLWKAGASAGRIRQNGTTRASSGTLSSVNLTALTLGARANGTSTQNCDIAEVVIYGRELSPAEMLGVERNLGLKYGLTIA